ncbi:hypothetical protein, partial [Absicoccus intestinalis]
FHGKTAYQVRQEALAADTPEQYPIAPNRRIERFWEKIEKSKAIGTSTTIKTRPNRIDLVW